MTKFTATAFSIFFTLTVFSQGSTNCYRQQWPFFSKINFQWVNSTFTPGPVKVTVTNTASQPLKDAAVIFKRRISLYNADVDTFRLIYNNNQKAFINTDTIKAVYGGSFEISAIGYNTLHFPLSGLAAAFEMNFTLGKTGDIFIPYYNRVYTLSCADEFIEFASVERWVNYRPRNPLALSINKTNPDSIVLRDTVMQQWLMSITKKYKLGNISGPYTPLASVGFSSHYTIAAGLYLPKEETKRQEILEQIKASGYTPTHLYYLADSITHEGAGVMRSDLEFTFDKSVPDSIISALIRSNDFTAISPVKSTVGYSQVNPDKTITVNYNGILSLDLLRAAGRIITTPGALFYNFKMY